MSTPSRRKKSVILLLKHKSIYDAYLCVYVRNLCFFCSVFDCLSNGFMELQKDVILREQITLHGTEKWSIIASKFKDKRTRQCRRWYTYLTVISKEEVVPLKKICFCLRTDNAVKNVVTISEIWLVVRSYQIPNPDPSRLSPGVGMSVARFNFSSATVIITRRQLIISRLMLCLIHLINKSEKAITFKADGVETLTPNQDQEASSEVLPINFNGLAKAVKKGDTIFVGQYLFTGNETTSVWLEMNLPNEPAS